VRRGVEQLYDAFCAAGLTVADFEGPRFKRIAHVKHRIELGEIDGELFPVALPQCKGRGDALATA